MMTWRDKTMRLLRDDDAWGMLKQLAADSAQKQRPAVDLVSMMPSLPDPTKPKRMIRAAFECGLIRASTKGNVVWYILSPRGRQLVDLIKAIEIAGGP